MLYRDLLEETFLAILSNKVRSGLTALGIVIGIGSVVAMMSIGQGATADITSNIQSLGSNLLIVSPGSQGGVGSNVRQGQGSAQTLVLSDSDAIKENISSAVSVAPTVSTKKQVIYKTNNTNTSIYGVDAEYLVIKNLEMEFGNFISDSVKRNSRVAVLGPTARDDLFGENVDPVGESIKIDTQKFTVIGVTQAKGGTGFGSSDDLIYIPLTTAQTYFTGSEVLSNISVQVESEELMVVAQNEINTLLLERHKISNSEEADFSIMNQSDIMDTVSSVTGALTLLLGAIAGISLVVGGIGIMNMMLTTVTERTREIGLRKSLGAKRKDITMQFLMESIVLTVVGGVIGIFFGWAVSWLVGKFGDMTTVVTFSSIFLSFGVSAFIGLVFGYYPARNAASLNPIEALRYE
ncbi:ABC transporter permease [Patescibacteria group bacterium]|nr:ABC transporter permease [Patescibacteria group bacterium]